MCTLVSGNLIRQWARGSSLMLDRVSGITESGSTTPSMASEKKSGVMMEEEPDMWACSTRVRSKEEGGSNGLMVATMRENSSMDNSKDKASTILQM